MLSAHYQDILCVHEQGAIGSLAWAAILQVFDLMRCSVKLTCHFLSCVPLHGHAITPPSLLLQCCHGWDCSDMLPCDVRLPPVSHSPLSFSFALLGYVPEPHAADCFLFHYAIWWKFPTGSSPKELKPVEFTREEEVAIDQCQLSVYQQVTCVHQQQTLDVNRYKATGGMKMCHKMQCTVGAHWLADSAQEIFFNGIMVSQCMVSSSTDHQLLVRVLEKLFRAACLFSGCEKLVKMCAASSAIKETSVTTTSWAFAFFMN